MEQDVLTSIAKRLHELVLDAHPFEATADGLPGYDAHVPDLSVSSAHAMRGHLAELAAEADVVAGSAQRSLATQVTLDVIRWTIERELTRLAHAGVDHVVSTILAEGPAVVLTTASRTRPGDAEAAGDYLERCAGVADYLDQHARRLVAGTGNGRYPVHSLVQAALAQVDSYLAEPRGDVVADVPSPAGWGGADTWRRDLAEVVERQVRPAFRRWRQTVAGLPLRPDSQAGLCHLPGGEADYAALIRTHTTLDLDPGELHRQGQELVESITSEIEGKGGAIGLPRLADVVAGYQDASAAATAATAESGFRDAVSRAERHLAQIVTGPLPPSCAVEAMPEHQGSTGHAPHYTSPTLDGTRRGTFWFNAQEPAAGGGWDLEALAYHEAVPGHHLQIWRAQRNEHLSDLQRHGFVPAHGEGWALYAEYLMQERGLYSSVHADIGALVLRLFRSARLVVDTGLHAQGWSVEEATRWLCTAVPVPPAFAAAEVRRYVAAPAQALAYAVGLQEILRLREAAQAAMGARFDLREFHTQVLDYGSVPLTSIRRVVAQAVGDPEPLSAG